MASFLAPELTGATVPYTGRLRGVVIVHLTARMRASVALFSEHEHCNWFWERMVESFPHTLAGTLMPNHPHWLALVTDADQAHRSFTRTCGHLQRRVGIRKLWDPYPPVEIVPRGQKLRRMIRYVALNQCRAGLADDPLSCLWSTYREAFGAVVDPIVDLAQLRRALRDWRPGFRGRFHAFVSSDPHVRVDGTPLPSAAPPRSTPFEPLESIAIAAAAATRSELGAIQARTPVRSLFWALARRQGWDDTRLLANYAGTLPRAVQKAFRRGVPAEALEATALCLGDPRLSGFEVRQMRPSTLLNPLSRNKGRAWRP